MYINTNISALNTLANLNRNQSASAHVMEGLASGKRINRASDDAAGSAVSARMQTQVRGLDVASRNANDGIAMIQTFEGAMSSQADILQRMRELAVQSSNGTYGTSDRSNLDAEFQQLSSEITDIAANTKFNGNAYISALNTVTLQISDVANDVLTISFAKSDATALTLNTQGISTQAAAETAITAIDTALNTVNSNNSALGALANRLNYTVNNNGNTKVNLADAQSRIEDLDMAAAMSDLTKYQVLQQSSISMLSQANQAPSRIVAMSVCEPRSCRLQLSS